MHNVELGTVIRVRCTASSSSAPTMTWFKDGNSLTNDPPHVRIRTSTDGTAVVSTLTVDNFNFTDDGIYFCQASNDTNSESSTTLSLTSKLFTQYTVLYCVLITLRTCSGVKQSVLPFCQSVNQWTKNLNTKQAIYSFSCLASTYTPG